MVGLAGLEFRNALFGHVHGLGLTGLPELRHTGDEGTDHPWDWPPNSVACEELRSLGAHHRLHAPGVRTRMTGVRPGGPSFRTTAASEARELPADAALGLVGLRSTSWRPRFARPDGAAHLYHRLLNCGLRLAATAGTDVFLSFAHLARRFSNPPGCGRVFADLGASGCRWQLGRRRCRAGRTVVTNGPWLSIELDGHGPGDVVDRQPGRRLAVRAPVPGVRRRAAGPSYGPDGEWAATVERCAGARWYRRRTVTAPGSRGRRARRR